MNRDVRWLQRFSNYKKALQQHVVLFDNLKKVFDTLEQKEQEL